ncbi:DUF2490 domain-containing protein [Sphingomonas sp. RS6]
MRTARSHSAAMLPPFLALAFASAPAEAQDDTQSWGSLSIAAPIAPSVDATLETQLRLTDDSSRAGQMVLRPSLTYRLKGGTSVTLGYAYVHTDPAGPASSDEHRAWQQIAYRLFQNDHFTIGGRTRLEQRLVEGSGDLGWRLRQQLRATLPVADDGKIKAVLWNETFVALDDTRWGQHAGFDQTRLFAGVSLPIARGTTIEPGYLYQHIFREGDDRSNHVLAITAQARLF